MRTQFNIYVFIELGNVNPIYKILLIVFFYDSFPDKFHTHNEDKVVIWVYDHHH
jgi:hypothetical protein